MGAKSYRILNQKHMIERFADSTITNAPSRSLPKVCRLRICIFFLLPEDMPSVCFYLCLYAFVSCPLWCPLRLPRRGLLSIRLRTPGRVLCSENSRRCHRPIGRFHCLLCCLERLERSRYLPNTLLTRSIGLRSFFQQRFSFDI